LQKPSEFAFITITNPSQIKDARKQTAIRRHARASTTGKTQQRRKRLKLVFDLPDAPPQATVEHSAVVAQSVDIVQNDDTANQASNEQESDSSSSPYDFSASVFKPIGAGRGLDPLHPFPFAVNSRLRDLTNFGLKPCTCSRQEHI
jgi:hypothetical protein